MLFLDTNTILYYLHDVKPYSQIVEDITSKEDELYKRFRNIHGTMCKNCFNYGFKTSSSS